METKSKMVNKNVDINNSNAVNGNQYNITTNNYNIFSLETIIKKLDENKSENKTIEYTEFFKRYTNKFIELEDYMMSLLFPKYIDKKYDFSSNTLVFGKKILEWILGASKYPISEIEPFYKELKEEFEIEEESLISKRWKANILYFDGNIEEAKKIYLELYEDVDKNEKCPVWLKDDILIDGRNIINKDNEQHNVFSFSNIFQEKLKNNKHKLSYPDVDRIRLEIFDTVSKHIFDNKNKGKYTQIFGTGITSIFNEIQTLSFIAIFYGSITHLKLIRRLIADVMYIYADTFEDDDYYKTTLKMLFLLEEDKKFKKLCKMIELKHRFVNNIDFINELNSSIDSTTNFDKFSREIFIYDLYGRKINDNMYDIFENDMIEYLNKDEKYQFNIISEVLNGILQNIIRFKNIGKLLEIINKYIDKEWSRFYQTFEKIVNKIHVEKLDEKEFDKYVNIVYALVNNKNKYDVFEALFKIKEYRPEIQKFDDILLNVKTQEGKRYSMENENIEKVLENILIEKERKYKERESNPGTICYGIEYNINEEFFIKDNYKSKTRNLLITKFLNLAEKLLPSPHFTFDEKAYYLYVLLRIMNVEEDIEVINKIINLINKKDILECKKDIFDSGIVTEIELKYIINTINYIGKKITEKDLICYYIEGCINKIETVETILKCIKIIKDKIKLEKDVDYMYLYNIFLFAFNCNDIEIREALIEECDIFIDTNAEEKMIVLLTENSKDITVNEARGYVKLLLNIDKNSRGKFKKIIEELEKSTDYYIKLITKTHLTHN